MYQKANYGALLKENGVFVNKNMGLFEQGMTCPIGRIMPKKYTAYNRPVHVAHNAYIWCGNNIEQFVVMFDELFLVYRDELQQLEFFGETDCIYTNCGTKISYRLIDPECSSKRHVMITTKSASYEIVYGFGIDPQEKEYNRIKNDKELGYAYTERQIEFIDKWFYAPTTSTSNSIKGIAQIFGERIKHERLDKKITVTSLSRQAGVSLTSLTRAEDGLVVTLPIAEKIAKGLGYELRDLI